MPPSRSVPWVRTSEKARSKHYDEQGSYFEVPCAPYSLGFPFGGATGGTTTDEGCTVAVATFWAALTVRNWWSIRGVAELDGATMWRAGPVRT